MDPENFCYYPPPPPTESIRAKLGLPPQMDVGNNLGVFQAIKYFFL